MIAKKKQPKFPITFFPIAFCRLRFAFCILPFAFCLLPIAFCLLLVYDKVYISLEVKAATGLPAIADIPPILSEKITNALQVIYILIYLYIYK